MIVKSEIIMEKRCFLNPPTKSPWVSSAVHAVLPKSIAYSFSNRNDDDQIKKYQSSYNSFSPRSETYIKDFAPGFTYFTGTYRNFYLKSKRELLDIQFKLIRSKFFNDRKFASNRQHHIDVRGDATKYDFGVKIPSELEIRPVTREPALKTCEPAPRTYEPASRTYEAAPKTCEAAPRTFEAAPRTYEAAPKTYEPASRTYESAPRTFEAAPRTYEAAPRTFEPAPRTYEPAPRTFEAAPRTYEPAPKTCETAPWPFELVPTGRRSRPIKINSPREINNCYKLYERPIEVVDLTGPSNEDLKVRFSPFRTATKSIHFDSYR